MMKMAEVIRGIFGDAMDEKAAMAYAGKLEVALWGSFKEMVNGKEAPGGRYK